MFTHESLLELRSNPRRTRKVKSLAQAYSIDRSIDRSMEGGACGSQLWSYFSVWWWRDIIKS